MTNAATHTDRQHLLSWLTGQIASFLGCPHEDVDPDAPLGEYGLDSLYATMLCGDIEDNLGLSLEPTVMWDHPSINALTDVLVTELGVES